MAPKSVRDILEFLRTSDSDRSILPSSYASALTHFKDYVYGSFSAVANPFSIMAPNPMGDVLEFLLAPWTFVSDRSILPWSYASALTHFEDYAYGSFSAVAHPFSIMVPKPMRNILELLLAPWTFVSDRSILPWSYASALTHFKDYVYGSFSAVAHLFSIMALKPIRDFLELFLAPWTFVSDRCIFLWSYASALTHFKDYVYGSFSAVAHLLSVMALKPIKDILELLLALWTFVSDHLIFLWSYVSALTYFAIIIIAIVVLAIVVILAIPFAPTIVVAAMIVIQWFVAFVAIAFIVCVFVVLACVALAFFIIWRMFVVLRMVLNAFWTLLLHYLSFRQRGVQRGSYAANYQSTRHGGNVPKSSTFGQF